MYERVLSGGPDAWPQGVALSNGFPSAKPSTNHLAGRGGQVIF